MWKKVTSAITEEEADARTEPLDVVAAKLQFNFTQEAGHSAVGTSEGGNLALAC